MSKPGIIIAGTNSGCGKTTVTAGVLAALVKKGLKVQPFKVGPDFIDPMFHTFITGRYSRNLDSWMLDEDIVKQLYDKNTSIADIAVIEGVMGLYDGYGGRSDIGSTAHVARITGLPIILVVDPDGMALSAAALVKGFMEFGKDVPIRGVIFNGINSEGHYALMKDIVESNTGIKVLGYLKRMDEYRLGSRHLGLVTAAEVEQLRGKMDALCAQVEETVDLAGLLAIAEEASARAESACMDGTSGTKNPTNRVYWADAAGMTDTINTAVTVSMTCTAGTADTVNMICAAGDEKVRIAVAFDKAFCFYYRDNLELFEELGAELVYFSPLADERLPDGIDGLYVGGGYPEIRAAELECNTAMRQDIRRGISGGLPTYAECGGLMYMCDAIRDINGRMYEMAGVIPGICEMTADLNRFGYVEIVICRNNILSYKNQKIRGHEFHFSRIKTSPEVETCYRVLQNKAYCGDGRKVGEVNSEIRGDSDSRECGTTGWNCGFKVGNLLAGYAHLHFLSNPLFARQFLNNCRLRKHNPEWRI